MESVRDPNDGIALPIDREIDTHSLGTGLFIRNHFVASSPSHSSGGWLRILLLAEADTITRWMLAPFG